VTTLGDDGHTAQYILTLENLYHDFATVNPHELLDGEGVTT
jgi:hypothetical protein